MKLKVDVSKLWNVCEPSRSFWVNPFLSLYLCHSYRLDIAFQSSKAKVISVFLLLSKNWRLSGWSEFQFYFYEWIYLISNDERERLTKTILPDSKMFVSNVQKSKTPAIIKAIKFSHLKSCSSQYSLLIPQVEDSVGGGKGKWIHMEDYTNRRSHKTNCFSFSSCYLSSLLRRGLPVVSNAFSQSHEIEMFINRNREMKKTTREWERLYLNWRSLDVLKLQLFTLWRLVRFVVLATICFYSRVETAIRRLRNLTSFLYLMLADFMSLISSQRKLDNRANTFKGSCFCFSLVHS